jgi:hypothetical protein
LELVAVRSLLRGFEEREEGEREEEGTDTAELEDQLWSSLRGRATAHELTL